MTDVWNRREAIYGSVMNLVARKDTIAVFEYLLANVKGLAQAKAGFCVQLIFGEMGCIDMHNVNLYSQFYLDRGQPRSKANVFQPDHLNGLYMRSPASKRDLDMYNALDPRKFSSKPVLPGPRPSGVVDARQMRTWGNRTERFKAGVKAYVDVLKALEKDGFNTIKLWDVWVSYVANNYVKSSPRKDGEGDEDGGSRYARDGLLSGNPLDPANDPTDARIMRTTSPIPDRNTLLTQAKNIRWVKDPTTGVMKPIKKDNDESNPLDTFSVDGMDKEPSAGAASLAHGATWWWRTPEYWWDLIRQAQGHRAKDGIRYASDDWAGPISDVAKPLAYLATEPEMLDNLFPDRDERRRFKRELDDVLKRHDFWRKKDYKPSGRRRRSESLDSKVGLRGDVLMMMTSSMKTARSCSSREPSAADATWTSTLAPGCVRTTDARSIAGSRTRSCGGRRPARRRRPTSRRFVRVPRRVTVGMPRIFPTALPNPIYSRFCPSNQPRGQNRA